MFALPQAAEHAATRLVTLTGGRVLPSVVRVGSVPPPREGVVKTGRVRSVDDETLGRVTARLVVVVVTTKSGSRQQVPSGSAVHNAYCPWPTRAPQQSPPSQEQPQLLFPSLQMSASAGQALSLIHI